MQDNHTSSGQQNTPDVITPVDFSPPPPPGRRLSWRPRWYHGLVVVGLLMATTAAWFVLTARSVFVDVTPMIASIEVTDGFAIRVGPRYLMRQGDYQLQFSAEGYIDSEAQLSVGEPQAQTHSFELTPLPGLVSVTTRDALGEELRGARVLLDGVDLGTAPLFDAEVPPGTYDLQIQAERYLPYIEQVEIEGRQIEQALNVTLSPAWANISFASQPAGADIIVNGEVLDVTPATVEMLQGAYDVIIKRSGYKAWQDDILVDAGVAQQLPAVALEAADGLVFIRSTPGSANVTINGQYRGQTPLEVSLPPGREHDIRLFRTGFDTAVRRVQTGSDEARDMTVVLDPITNPVRIIVEPADAELYVNGELKGAANQTVNLIAASQRIEIRRDGYVPYATNFTSRPGLDQEIRVSLKTEEQARLESIEPIITNAAGQTLHLFYPYEFTMGSSRREPGRRANETLRDVVMEKPFYLSLHTVTNEQFKRFKADHASGTLQGQSLDRPNQPAVQVSWLDAALYTNWLSSQEGLVPFYLVEEGAVTGINADANGYRLPTEAEWEWAARADGQAGTTRFAWGEDWPPSAGSGNFADESTSNFLGQILRGYNDGVQGSANVGEFAANAQGLFDMAGNVSEWVHDYYGAVSGLSSVKETDPLGPGDGSYRTIKGSSWAHGSMTELRASYRDFGEEPRNDLGFRVARYLGQ
ncbi:MAG: PEGA domain-containing protein [Pseudohongiella sp.]|uniref:PEGA domain-containing protein n=1 Tax=Pseudohongiella sp. TaxID=1979412 RepID=UPI0034A01C88